MALRHYANAAATTLSLGVTNSATAITLTSIAGLPVSFPFVLIVDRNSATEEVVLVTASGGGTTLTVTRGYDGSTAFAHSTGAVVEHGISAIDPREANAHVNATAGVHGVAGSVVGTSDAQALTNKDLTNATNTFPSSLVTLTGTQVLTNKDLTSATNLFPTSLVTLTGLQTLTNKTLTTPTINTALITGGTMNNVTQVEPDITNNNTADVSLKVDAIAGTTASLATFAINGANKLLIDANGDIQGPNITGAVARTQRPYARLTKSINQTLTVGTDTYITWDAVDEETDASFGDIANEQLVAPINGVYFVQLNVQFDSNATGVRIARIHINGSTNTGQIAPGSSGPTSHVNVAMMRRLSAGDTIKAEGVTTGVGLAVLAAATSMSAIWLVP